MAGFVIEVQQQDLWRTDVTASADFHLLVQEELPEVLGATTVADADTTVACAISITGLLDEDVQRHIAAAPESNASAVLFLQPETGTGRKALQNAGDAVALASYGSGPGGRWFRPLPAPFGSI